MDADERHEMNEEARIDAEFQCPHCGKWVDGICAIDPILNEDSEPICDLCAADLVNIES